jgi:protein-tyrosine-phosphatase
MKYKKVVFICSANMSRSPMAEAIFVNLTSHDPELRSADIYAKSAATFGIDGEKATSEAVQVMAEMGLDISPHKTRQIDEEFIDWADLILVMEYQHVRYLTDRFPKARKKVHLLSEFVGEKGEIDDPFRRGMEAYRECFSRLAHLLRLVLEKMKS